MVSLELAVEQGAKVLKVDVRGTNDGKIVLMKDETIDRTTNGHGTLKKILFDELRLYDAGSWLSDRFKGETVPLLREVLRFAKLNQIKLILDVREHGLEVPILGLLESTDMLKDVYLWGTLSNLREKEPSIVGPKLVFLSPDRLTPSEIEDAHARGMQVMTSLLGCDDLEEIRKVARNGADVLLVDFPAVAAEALDQPGAQRIKKIKKREPLRDAPWKRQAGEDTGEPAEDVIEEKEGFDLLDPVHSIYNFLLGGALREEEVDKSQRGLPLSEREKLIALRRALKEPGLEEKGFFARRWRTLNKGLGEGEVEESRRAALMLAALPPEAVLPTLLKGLEYKRPAVRANSAWALGLVGDAKAIPKLIDHLWEEDLWVRREVILALGRIKHPDTVEPLRKVLTSKMDISVIYDAARALGEIGVVEAVGDLIRLMEKERSWLIKGGCASALSKIKDERAVEPLGRLLLQESGDPDAYWVKDVAAWALSDLGKPAGEMLIRAMRSQSEETRRRASWAMVRMGEPALPFLTKTLRDPDPTVSKKAAEALGWLGNEQVVPSLIRIIQDSPPELDGLRRSAVWALGKIGDPRAEKVLDRITRSEEDKKIKEMAEEAILRLSQK